MHGAGDLQIPARRGRGREVQQLAVFGGAPGHGAGECARSDGSYRAELF